MDTVNIRQAIIAAKQHEQSTAQLAGMLKARVDGLHHAIQLPAENIVPVLLNFVIRYIDHVPEFVDAVDAITERAGLSEHIEPVMMIAREFFAQPPELLAGHEGMDALMDESYLAHRLIEEVNDRFMANTGSHLIPMDMTRSNLIIHHLIGEPFANQLDQAVHLIVNHLEYYEDVFTGESLLQRLNQAAAHWSKDPAEMALSGRHIIHSVCFESNKRTALTGVLHLLQAII